MNRVSPQYLFWLGAGMLILFACPCLRARDSTGKPNILFLFTDDQRHDTIGALGNDEIQTPHVDQLVERGMAFTNAYIMGGSSPAVCSPSRASLFSGRTLWNLENQGIWGFEISSRFKTLPQVFREAGYVTFATGKNEPGREGHFARSFSDGDKILFRGMSHQYRLPLCPFSRDGDYSKKNEVLHTGKHSAEVYADACIDFLKREAGGSKPFFAYVSFQTPHDPKQCPDPFMKRYRGSDLPLPVSFKTGHPFDNGMLRIRDEKLEKFPRDPDRVRDHIAAYYAMISHTDAQVGRILHALEKSGRMEETLIVYASDNGLAVGRHGLMGKQNVYEHSVRVPLIISGPGIPKGETRSQLCYLYDIYPTLCERAGLETPATVEFSSLNPIVNDENASHREVLYFAFMSWQRAIRDERHKLIEYCVEGTRDTQLFDLNEDGHETNNLAGDPKYGAVLMELRNRLEKERVLFNDGNTPYDFTNEQGKHFWGVYDSVKTFETP